MTVISWILLIALPSLVCALSDTQIPFHIPADNSMMPHGSKPTFRFKEGSDVFTPKDLVQLSRPGTGVANVPGDLILVPVSKYSFEDKKYVRSFILAYYSVHLPFIIPPTPGLVSDLIYLPDALAQQSFWRTGHEEMCRKHVLLPPDVPGP